MTEDQFENELLRVLVEMAEDGDELAVESDAFGWSSLCEESDDEPGECAYHDGDRCSSDAVSIESVSTFAQAGVLTRNKGLVVRLSDGSEMQLTLVCSRQTVRS